VPKLIGLGLINAGITNPVYPTNLAMVVAGAALVGAAGLASGFLKGSEGGGGEAGRPTAPTPGAAGTTGLGSFAGAINFNPELQVTISIGDDDLEPVLARLESERADKKGL